MNNGNIFAEIPSDLSQEVFEPLAQRGDVRIERIISKGQTSPASDWYDQAQPEWVIVLQGTAELTFENGKIAHLEHGDYLQIEPHEKHRVTSTSTNPATIWLAIHY